VANLQLITPPMHVVAYIERHPSSPQKIKQNLAVVEMLFDYLVVSQVLPANPTTPLGRLPLGHSFCLHA
jgi:hypothetical protein